MKKSKQELKQMAIDAIDKRRDDIISLGDSIYREPELGYKEFKTADKIKEVFDDLAIPYEDGIAITGVKGLVKGAKSNYRIGLMGELDSVVSPKHPDADPETGAAHCCGHNCMIAGLAGVAYALKDTDIMEHLDGDISLMAIPAEEFVEIGYRNNLIKEGKISFLGGKQEFIKLGAFDDIDIALIQHTSGSEDGIKAVAGGSNNGFIGQEIQYKGKEAHAGGSPHKGINALNAANLGLMAIHAQRETFRDQDNIRVHPIITKGGDLVNTIPADVKLENYIRGSNVEAIISATEKVTRSWYAGAYAIGADCLVDTLPGYLPLEPNKDLQEIMYGNLKYLFGDESVKFESPHSAGSTDVGDVSSIVPTLQASIGGAEGNFHADNYRLVDRDLAYLGAAKALILSAIDLLYDEGKESKKIIDNFTPIYNKESYLEEWGRVGERFEKPNL